MIPARRAAAIGAAVWCLGFAAVNVWQLVTGRLVTDELRDHATALIVASVAVLLLKLLGALAAIASIRTAPEGRGRWLLGAALWGATSTLGVYAAGSVVIAVGTSAGVMEATAAWRAAGGVTPRAIAYVLFFLAGAAMFAALTVSYHRRQRLGWTAVLAGAAGAPALLGGLLVVLPSLLAP